MAASIGSITVNVDVVINGHRVLIFDADTGERLNPSEPTTSTPALVAAASLLPGIPEAELDRWYDEYMSHDDPQERGRLQWVADTDRIVRR